MDDTWTLQKLRMKLFNEQLLSHNAKLVFIGIHIITGLLVSLAPVILRLTLVKNHRDITFFGSNVYEVFITLNWIVIGFPVVTAMCYVYSIMEVILFRILCILTTINSVCISDFSGKTHFEFYKNEGSSTEEHKEAESKKVCNSLLAKAKKDKSSERPVSMGPFFVDLTNPKKPHNLLSWVAMRHDTIALLQEYREIIFYFLTPSVILPFLYLLVLVLRTIFEDYYEYENITGQNALPLVEDFLVVSLITVWLLHTMIIVYFVGAINDKIMFAVRTLKDIKCQSIFDLKKHDVETTYNDVILVDAIMDHLQLTQKKQQLTYFGYVISVKKLLALASAYVMVYVVSFLTEAFD